MLEIEGILGKASVFRGLAKEDLAEVFNIVREERFRQGQTIMQEGDEGAKMYILVDGELSVSKTLTMKFGEDDYRKTEKALNKLNAKHHPIFGEMALIAQDKRSASVTCDTDCLLLEINREDFLRLVETRPEMGIRILLNISAMLIKRLQQADQDVIRLTTALSIALSR
jgi:CRP/FNR family transcriptional regulator, cyclic AMP receptor protein